MSYSDTSAAKRYASIAEVAAAECKNLTEEARKAPQYTDDARKAAQDAEAAATAATSAASSAQISFNGSSQNAIIAQSAASSASADASLAQASELAAKQSEISAADSATTAVAAVNKTIRSPDTDLSPLPSVADRKGKLCAFDANGNVIASVPASGSATEVYETLAGPDGATYVHYGTQTVADVLSTVGDKISGALTFTAGGTVNTAKDFVYDSLTKSWYYWSGTFPFTFAASSSPSSNSSWLCAGDSVITSKLASSNYGTGIVSTILPLAGAISRTQKERNADWVSVKDFPPTGDDWTNAFKQANIVSLYIDVPVGTYKITDSLILRDGTVLRGAGKTLTKLQLYDNDVDLIVMGWDCTLENMSLESLLPSGPTYTKGLVRWQSTTNPEIPPAAVALGGLSYRNKIRNVEMRSGQAYNFYSFGVGYAEWYNTDALLARGSANVYLDGSDSYVARGTTLFMHGVNKITACLGGDGLVMNNNFGMHIYGIFEGNKGRAVSVFGYSDSNTIDGYYENNFATSVGGSGNGDAVVKFESSVTRGCFVKGYFDTLNAQNALQIHGLATGFNNRAQYSVREYNDQRSFNRKNGFSNLSGINCEWEIDNALQYYKEADLGEVRSSGKLTFNQCLMFSPYSMIRNPKFNAWTSSTPDNWSGAAVKVSGGYAGSDYYANLNSYPSAFLQQSSINTRFEHSLVYCSLVIVGRGGHSINLSSPDYNGTNRTVVIISTSSGNTFLEIPQQNFGDDWDAKIISLNEIYSGDLPPKSSITAMTINVYCSSGTNIGYVGLHDNSAGMFIPSDK